MELLHLIVLFYSRHGSTLQLVRNCGERLLRGLNLADRVVRIIIFLLLLLRRLLGDERVDHLVGIVHKASRVERELLHKTLFSGFLQVGCCLWRHQGHLNLVVVVLLLLLLFSRLQVLLYGVLDHDLVLLLHLFEFRVERFLHVSHLGCQVHLHLFYLLERVDHRLLYQCCLLNFYHFFSLDHQLYIRILRLHLYFWLSCLTHVDFDIQCGRLLRHFGSIDYYFLLFLH